MSRAAKFKLAICAFASVFILLGCLLIPKAGVEGDEAFFVWPIYDGFQSNFGIKILHHALTLMVFPYAGALKTWLFWPVLKVFGPSVWALRLPAILLGALTIAIFAFLIARLLNVTAALFSAALLATDPSFLLTNTFDWGPVAIEHLLFVSACALAVCGRLPLAAFFFGVALWNKTSFVWSLAGFVAGALVAYLPEVRKRLDKRTAAKCIGSLLLGALPLIVYNLHSANATGKLFQPSFEGFSLKVSSLRQTLDGSVLFGILTSTANDGMPKEPDSAAGKLAGHIEQTFGQRRYNLFLYGILAALLSAPLWWRSEARAAVIFSITAAAVGFFIMAGLRKSGAAHHIVLLYPLPHLLVGAALSVWRPKWIAVGAIAALAGANLLVINEYLFELDTFGTHGLFTDALKPLSAALPDGDGHTVYTLDVLVGDSLDFMHEGHLHLQRATTVLSLPRSAVTAMILDPDGIFVRREPGLEYYKGATDLLDTVAGELGYRHLLLQTVPDSNGRPHFEIFRYQQVSQ